MYISITSIVHECKIDAICTLRTLRSLSKCILYNRSTFRKQQCTLVYIQYHRCTFIITLIYNVLYMNVWRNMYIIVYIIVVIYCTYCTYCTYCIGSSLMYIMYTNVYINVWVWNADVRQVCNGSKNHLVPFGYYTWTSD